MELKKIEEILLSGSGSAFVKDASPDVCLDIFSRLAINAEMRGQLLSKISLSRTTLLRLCTLFGDKLTHDELLKFQSKLTKYSETALELLKGNKLSQKLRRSALSRVAGSRGGTADRFLLESMTTLSSEERMLVSKQVYKRSSISVESFHKIAWRKEELNCFIHSSYNRVFDLNQIKSLDESDSISIMSMQMSASESPYFFKDLSLLDLNTLKKALLELSQMSSESVSHQRIIPLKYHLSQIVSLIEKRSDLTDQLAKDDRFSAFGPYKLLYPGLDKKSMIKRFWESNDLIALSEIFKLKTLSREEQYLTIELGFSLTKGNLSQTQFIESLRSADLDNEITGFVVSQAYKTDHMILNEDFISHFIENSDGLLSLALAYTTDDKSKDGRHFEFFKNCLLVARSKKWTTQNLETLASDFMTYSDSVSLNISSLIRRKKIASGDLALSEHTSVPEEDVNSFINECIKRNLCNIIIVKLLTNTITLNLNNLKNLLEYLKDREQQLGEFIHALLSRDFLADQVYLKVVSEAIFGQKNRSLSIELISKYSVELLPKILEISEDWLFESASNADISSALAYKYLPLEFANRVFLKRYRIEEVEGKIKLMDREDQIGEFSSQAELSTLLPIGPILRREIERKASPFFIQLKESALYDVKAKKFIMTNKVLETEMNLRKVDLSEPHLLLLTSVECYKDSQLPVLIKRTGRLFAAQFNDLRLGGSKNRRGLSKEIINLGEEELEAIIDLKMPSNFRKKYSLNFTISKDIKQEATRRLQVITDLNGDYGLKVNFKGKNNSPRDWAVKRNPLYDLTIFSPILKGPEGLEALERGFLSLDGLAPQAPVKVRLALYMPELGQPEVFKEFEQRLQDYLHLLMDLAPAGAFKHPMLIDKKVIELPVATTSNFHLKTIEFIFSISMTSKEAKTLSRFLRFTISVCDEISKNLKGVQKGVLSDQLCHLAALLALMREKEKNSDKKTCIKRSERILNRASFLRKIPRIS